MDVIYCFKIFSENTKHFEIWLFLVFPLYKEARVTLCTIGTKMEDKGTNLFHKYSNKVHFLIGNGSYIFNKIGLSNEEIYLKKWLVTFVKELGREEGVIPYDETSRKHLK